MAIGDTITIKLMLDKKGRRIMYAEAGKDFVDLLFGFLVLPSGAIAKHALDSKLAAKSEDQEKVSCITNLYKSVESLSSSLMKADKSVLLDPKVVSTTYTNNLLRIQSSPAPPPPPAAPPRYYVCNNAGYGSFSHSLSTQPGTATCPCGYSVSREVKLADKPPVAAKEIPALPTGYVKEKASFVITDDLNVMPFNSTATMVKLWNKLDVKEPTELKERNVTVGPNEVMGLLKAAMVSDTALNDVFKTDSKFSTTVDTDTNRISVQEFLLKLLADDLKSRSSKGGL